MFKNIYTEYNIIYVNNRGLTKFGGLCLGTESAYIWKKTLEEPKPISAQADS